MTVNVTHILKELGEHFISVTKHGFMYGPQGKMLLKNLEDHWFLHCITMSQHNIFLSNGFSNSFNFITKSETSDIPFGLAMKRSLKNCWNQNILDEPKINYHQLANIVIFNNDIETKDMFHKIQKERKIWWRKLAQYPSRFKLTESKKLKTATSMEIEAQFSFGNIIVEKITYQTDVKKSLSEVDSKKDFSYIQMVEHTVSLDWGCLALLCDAYDSNKETKMNIHTKLAPHKVAFHIKRPHTEVDPQNDDLNRFVLYLNNMLRAKGLNTLLTSSEQIIDTCLVPFIVSVDATSLDNGIIHVRDRSTTLNEAIHVTDLVKYIIMRC